VFGAHNLPVAALPNHFNQHVVVAHGELLLESGLDLHVVLRFKFVVIQG